MRSLMPGALSRMARKGFLAACLSTLPLSVVLADGVQEQILYAFDYYGTDGGAAMANLVQGSDGNFYGMSTYGGVNGAGTVYQLTPDGVLTTLHSFSRVYSADNGAMPMGALVEGNDGAFYGTTSSGGSNGIGTVFRVTTDGTLTILHSFADTGDGYAPTGALVKAADGFLYGLSSDSGLGVVFRIAPSSEFSVFYTFAADGSQGAFPDGLTLGADGNLYGVTHQIGSRVITGGSVFRLKLDGTFTTLHRFPTASSKGTASSIMQASDGNLYGTFDLTAQQMYSAGSTLFFRIGKDGTYTQLYQLGGSTSAGQARGALIQGTDGNLYGALPAGGSGTPPRGLGNRDGGVFRLGLDGSYTLLYSFTGSNGNSPNGVIQGSDGGLYGTTYTGGPLNASGQPSSGVVFKLTGF